MKIIITRKEGDNVSNLQVNRCLIEEKNRMWCTSQDKKEVSINSKRKKNIKKKK